MINQSAPFNRPDKYGICTSGKLPKNKEVFTADSEEAAMREFNSNKHTFPFDVDFLEFRSGSWKVVETHKFHISEDCPSFRLTQIPQ